MDLGMVRFAGEQLNRASSRDEDIKAAARLLLVDLAKVDERLERAIARVSKAPLGDDLLPPDWERHLESFARLYSRAEGENWEQLRKLLDVRGYLDSKRVIGSDGPLDVREQGWVWLLLATHRVGLRLDMHELSTTPWWRRRLRLHKTEGIAQAIRMGIPPLPPAVRDVADRGADAAPDIPWDEGPEAHWDLENLRGAVMVALSGLTAEERQLVADRLETS